MVLNSSTRHPFQSNQSVVKDALLASYRRLKMPFCPLLVPNGTPIGLRSYANWGTIGVRLAPNWHPIGHLSRLTGSIGEGQYYSTKLLIESIIQSNRGQVHVRTENVIFCTLFYILIWTRDRGRFTIENLRAGWTHEMLMMFWGLELIVSIVQRRSS